MVDVKGRWALITGAARGIGYLTARFMAEKGCNLILHSRSLAHTEKVLEEVIALGAEARAVAADLSDPAAVRRMLEEIDGLEQQKAVHEKQIDELNKDIGKVTVKHTDVNSDDNYFFAEGVKLNAYEEFQVKLPKKKLTVGAASALKLVLDFGGNPDDTQVTCKEIIFQKTAQ